MSTIFVEQARAAQRAEIEEWRRAQNAWPPSPERAAQYAAISREAWYAAKTCLARAGCHSRPLVTALKLTILREVARTLDDGDRLLRWHEQASRTARGIAT